MASGPITSWQIDEETVETVETVDDFILGGSKITAGGDCSHEIKRLLERKAVTNLDSTLKSRDKGACSQSYGFSSGHVGMWKLGHKEGCASKNWCFQTVVLEKTLENLLDCKEIQPVNRKGNQSRIFIGRTDAEAPILWLPDVKNWLIWKDPDAGKKWRREEKGMDDRGWDGWMASPTWWTWVCVSSGSWWWTGRPGILQSMGLQRVRHNLATEEQCKRKSRIMRVIQSLRLFVPMNLSQFLNLTCIHSRAYFTTLAFF